MKRFSVSLAALVLIGLSGASALAQGTLRAGDMIEIRLAGVPPEEIGTFSAPHTLDEAGMLNLPFVGLVKASGLRANQLQTIIEKRLKDEKIYTQPTVTVSIANSVRFVNVRGAVRNPSRVAYTADLTLMTAINAAGGFNEFGGKKVRLARDGKLTVIDVKLISKDPSKDFPVQPGDQIEALTSMW
jgi:protein involved in polysaccharide export with SLBB domain